MHHQMSAVILAASEGAAEHSNPLIPEPAELIWGAVCFLLLLLVASRLIFPRVNKTFADRSTNIEGKLTEAERQRAEAAELLRRQEALLHEARVEGQKIVEQARSNADRLEDELRLQAEDKAQRILERAQEQIGAERDRALSTLKNEVGVLAVDLATRVVGDSLDRERQLRLVDQYISELPRS